MNESAQNQILCYKMIKNTYDASIIIHRAMLLAGYSYYPIKGYRKDYPRNSFNRSQIQHNNGYVSSQ